MVTKHPPADAVQPVLNPDTPGKIDKYILDKFGVVDIYPYANSLYLLTSNSIKRYTLQTDQSTDWIKQDQGIKDGNALAVEGSIFVLDGRDIVKFTDGKKANYTVDNSRLLKPIEIEAYEKRVYVLDADPFHKAVIVYDSVSGAFVEELSLADETDLEPVTDFTITKGTNIRIIYEKGHKLLEIPIK